MSDEKIQMIPIGQINILNPRARNRLIAEEIRKNIQNIGLKRPIKVTVKKKPENGKIYDLICGQGRLEALLASGETKVPAIVVEVSEEDACIMSLVENIARRHNTSLELLQSIRYLKDLGYDMSSIAQKTNLGKEYIKVVSNLMEKGEKHLVEGVEKGRIPLTLALKIATEDDISVRRALEEAYHSGQLTGKKLVTVQKLLEKRRLYGKGAAQRRKGKATLSAEELITMYENDLKNKKRLLLQAERVRNILTYTAAALKDLLTNVHFANQLKAEGLADFPKQVNDLLDMEG